ncbi:mechanosensitive ion channel [Hyphomonas sp. WL0036]|uniref:mechanosensitive ion channel family protein n=1 Tax=Hyphomonas sediminis TaxID=2866160 RepID=UPI001C7E91DA|nr:mechanosensitive ion channel domain-containing protein [Hyphomonas sediminis]MBY9066583.1 mechanosensitive ion channel [Hyphomonas sediminis]
MDDPMNPQTLWESLSPYLLPFGIRVIGAIILVIVGLRVASWLGNLVRRQSEKNARIDATLANFFASLVRWAIIAAVAIATLQVFGVQATSFVAILGALTLAIGLSMQGAMGNIASGVMIMVFRPYKLDDYIEAAGVAGTVKDISLFQTILATPDNIKVMVPNSQAIDGVIMNYSGFDRRRVDVTFGIDYDDDMDKAIGIVRRIIEADERVLKDPEPFVRVVNLGDSSVDIASRSWVIATDYWAVKFDILQKVKAAFDREGISIPYPHTTLVTKAPAAN